MLYDTTLCIGCKTCVVKCREANGLEPDTSLDGIHQAPLDLNARTKNVIKLYKEGPHVSYVKAQCMHCVDPACASACMLGSLHKDERTGVVGYDAELLRGLPLLPDELPVQRGQVRVREGGAEDRQVRAVPAPREVGAGQRGRLLALSDGRGAGLLRGVPAPGGDLRHPRGAAGRAKRRIAAEPGKYYQDRVYGETEGGGTQVLYLSHVPFEKLGLAALGEAAVPRHRLRDPGGALPGLRGPDRPLRRARGRDVPQPARSGAGAGQGAGQGQGGAVMKTGHAVVHAPVGGRILTPSFGVLLAFIALGAISALYRFATGLAGVSNLNDGYPWGIWIAFDVVTGTALGCGGYAVALLVYILNKGEYHPLVRPAVLTSLLGYAWPSWRWTIDLGRFWSCGRSRSSSGGLEPLAQLEVALCVAAYVLVLLVRAVAGPAFEKWSQKRPRA